MNRKSASKYFDHVTDVAIGRRKVLHEIAQEQSLRSCKDLKVLAWGPVTFCKHANEHSVSIRTDHLLTNLATG
jgi:hypothetical protein